MPDDPIVWRRVIPEPPLPPGEYEGTCLGVSADTSAAGNPMLVWYFMVTDYDNRIVHRVRYFTVRRRAETGLTAQALGLGKSFKLSEAVGRRCRVTVAKDRQYSKVTSVRPL